MVERIFFSLGDEIPNLSVIVENINTYQVHALQDFSELFQPAKVRTQQSSFLLNNVQKSPKFFVFELAKVLWGHVCVAAQFSVKKIYLSVLRRPKIIGRKLCFYLTGDQCERRAVPKTTAKERR